MKPFRNFTRYERQGSEAVGRRRAELLEKWNALVLSLPFLA